jgi:hypothetical protein
MAPVWRAPIWRLKSQDRLLVQRVQEVLLAQPVQEAQEVPQPREGPAAQRDLGCLYRPSVREDPVVLRSSLRASDRREAQLLSRYACKTPSPH